MNSQQCTYMYMYCTCIHIIVIIISYIQRLRLTEAISKSILESPSQKPHQVHSIACLLYMCVTQRSRQSNIESTYTCTCR